MFLCQICAPDLLVSPENSRTLIFPKGKLKQTWILWPSCLSWELRNFNLTKRIATNKPGSYNLLASPENSGTLIYFPKGSYKQTRTPWLCKVHFEIRQVLSLSLFPSLLFPAAPTCVLFADLRPSQTAIRSERLSIFRPPKLPSSDLPD
jgi:hypothetical protein